MTDVRMIRPFSVAVAIMADVLLLGVVVYLARERLLESSDVRLVLVALAGGRAIGQAIARLSMGSSSSSSSGGPPPTDPGLLAITPTALFVEFVRRMLNSAGWRHA